MFGLSGWKTAASGVAMMVTGVGMIVKELVSDTPDWSQVQAGWTMVVSGLAVLGLGHKLDKVK